MAKSEYSKTIDKLNAANASAKMMACKCGASVPVAMFEKYNGCRSCFEAYCDGAHDDMARSVGYDTITQAEMRKRVRGTLSVRRHLPGSTPIEQHDENAARIDAAKREQQRAVAAYAREHGIDLTNRGTE